MAGHRPIRIKQVARPSDADEIEDDRHDHDGAERQQEEHDGAPREAQGNRRELDEAPFLLRGIETSFSALNMALLPWLALQRGRARPRIAPNPRLPAGFAVRRPTCSRMMSIPPPGRKPDIVSRCCAIDEGSAKRAVERNQRGDRREYRQQREERDAAASDINSFSEKLDRGPFENVQPSPRGNVRSGCSRRARDPRRAIPRSPRARTTVAPTGRPRPRAKAATKAAIGVGRFDMRACFRGEGKVPSQPPDPPQGCSARSLP